MLPSCMQESHIGSALGEEAGVPGGSVGIVVDLFAEGALLPALTQASSLEPVAAAPSGKHRLVLYTFWAA